MGNDKNVYERLWKLWTMICKMIMDGARDPDKVADILQTIVDSSKGYLRRLYETEVIKLGEAVFAVYEMVSSGTFTQLFGSLGDLNRLSFASRKQVDEFCRVHRDKLRTGGYATFFLYKEGENFFVADVYIHSDGRLGVGVSPLEDDSLWSAVSQRRVVVPQLAPA